MLESIGLTAIVYLLIAVLAIVSISLLIPSKGKDKPVAEESEGKQETARAAGGP